MMNDDDTLIPVKKEIRDILRDMCIDNDTTYTGLFKTLIKKTEYKERLKK